MDNMEIRDGVKSVHTWERTVLDQLVKEGRITIDPETGMLRLALFVRREEGYVVESVILTPELVDSIERQNRLKG